MLGDAGTIVRSVWRFNIRFKQVGLYFFQMDKTICKLVARKGVVMMQIPISLTNENTCVWQVVGSPGG